MTELSRRPKRRTGSALGAHERPGAIEVRFCPLCYAEGDLLHGRLCDRFFDVAGHWDLVRCSVCGLVWLTPRPADSEIGQLYRDYYTHAAAPTSGASRLRRTLRQAVLTSSCRFGQTVGTPVPVRLAARFLTLLPPVQRKAEREVLYLHGEPPGSLLDVGCGSGQFLAQMRALGWSVLGTEPDPRAAGIARSAGCDVYTGTIEDAPWPDNYFDAITLCHVIEHVADPVGVLRRCRALLVPGGLLVAATPNAAGLGHAWLGPAWRELDPPRHFFLFTPDTLTRCVELAGLRVSNRFSTHRNAAQIWGTSRQIRRTGRMRPDALSLPARVEGRLFQWIESTLQFISPSPIQEEIGVVARKR